MYPDGDRKAAISRREREPSMCGGTLLREKQIKKKTKIKKTKIKNIKKRSEEDLRHRRCRRGLSVRRREKMN